MIQMEVLGPFTLRFKYQLVDLQPMHELMLLGFVSAGGTLSADRLVEILWDQPTAGSAATSRGYVSRVRQKVKVLGGTGDEVISTLRLAGGRTHYRIPDGYALDANRFQEQIAAGCQAYRLGNLEASYARLGLTLKFWKGKPLRAAHERWWAFDYIDRLESSYKTGAITHLKAAIELGHHREAAAETRHLIDNWPEEEEAWQLLAIAHYRSGHIDEAASTCRRIIGSLRERGHNELSFQELQRAILARTLPWRGPLPAGFGWPDPRDCQK